MMASVPNEGEQQALLNRLLSGAGAAVSRDASNNSVLSGCCSRSSLEVLLFTHPLSGQKCKSV